MWFQELVKEYVEINGIKTPFAYNRPGRTWTKKFFKRNKLSLKKASMICISRKSNTANPFVIYDFYDKLQFILDSNPDITAENIWNCDESGFPTDPAKSKVVGPTNQPAYKLSFGARRENITTLAVCSASGKVLDPLIIFQGKHFQSTWRGTQALPNCYYGVTKNGWMETSTFNDWFELFTNEHTGRPMLLLFDGHMSHISVRVIEKALRDNIHILKFPPHVTDILQPLDKCCFGPLKRLWEKTLNERINRFGLVKKVDKAEFVNLLSKIWHEGMAASNAIAGFESTGIWPLNREKYDKSRFDVRIVRRYEEWVVAGKPSLDWTKCHSARDVLENAENVSATSVNTPTSRVSTPTTETAACEAVTPNCEKSTDLCQYDQAVMDAVGPFPFACPVGFKWVPNGWKLHPISSTPVEATSFEEVFLNRIKPMQKSPSKKRTRINLSATIVSDHELLKKLKKKEEKKKPEKHSADEDLLKPIDDDEDDDEEVVEEDESGEEESDFESDDEKLISAPKDIEDMLKIVHKCWKSVEVTQSEEYLKECYYAVVYIDPKKQKNMFIGKVLHRWLHDEQGTAKALTIDFLRQKSVNMDDNIFERYEHDGTDQDIPIQQVIAGPLRTSLALSEHRWSSPHLIVQREKWKCVITRR